MPLNTLTSRQKVPGQWTIDEWGMNGSTENEKMGNYWHLNLNNAPILPP